MVIQIDMYLDMYCQLLTQSLQPQSYHRNPLFADSARIIHCMGSMITTRNHQYSQVFRSEYLRNRNYILTIPGIFLTIPKVFLGYSDRNRQNGNCKIFQKYSEGILERIIRYSKYSVRNSQNSVYTAKEQLGIPTEYLLLK